MAFQIVSILNQQCASTVSVSSRIVAIIYHARCSSINNLCRSTRTHFSKISGGNSEHVRDIVRTALAGKNTSPDSEQFQRGVKYIFFVWCS